MGYAQFPVVNSAGKVTGVLTKSKVMEQLVKQRVTLDDYVSVLVQRELRHVSKSVTLNEMGRILVRNKFALVEGEKFITTSDLLKVLGDSDEKAEADCAKGCCGDKPAAKSESTGTKTMAAAVVGVGVAAIGAFFAMKNKQ